MAADAENTTQMTPLVAATWLRLVAPLTRCNVTNEYQTMKVASMMSNAPTRRARAIHKPPSSHSEAVTAAAKAPSSVFADPKLSRCTPSVAERITRIAPATATSKSGSVPSRRSRPRALPQAAAAATTVSTQAQRRPIATVATGRPSLLTKLPNDAGPISKWLVAVTPKSIKPSAAAPKMPIRKPRYASTRQASQITPTIKPMIMYTAST